MLQQYTEKVANCVEDLLRNDGNTKLLHFHVSAFCTQQTGASVPRKLGSLILSLLLSYNAFAISHIHTTLC